MHSLRETLTGCLTNIKSYPIITAIVTIFNVHKVTQNVNLRQSEVRQLPGEQLYSDI